jgi:4,5-dihydroxyphthalate decarboxylase
MVRLSLSCGVYDRTLPLLLGLVKPEGVELELPPLELGRGMGSPDADVYEMPVPGFIMRRAREDTHRALTIFVRRTFFHQLILVREDSDLRGLADLRGKRVGIMNWYQHAMGVWLRGHLQEAHGVAPEEIAWTTERLNAFPMSESSRVQITIKPADVTLPELLARGELDAIVHEQAHGFLAQYPSLRRLFPNHRELETDYYRATGCFPLVHALVIRKELVAEHPGLADSLVRTFEESKRTYRDLMHRSNALVSVAWMDDWLEEEGRRLGPDPFAYGLERTRPEIERLVRYLCEQELIPAPLAVEEIFAG